MLDEYLFSCPLMAEVSPRELSDGQLCCSYDYGCAGDLGDEQQQRATIGAPESLVQPLSDATRWSLVEGTQEAAVPAVTRSYHQVESVSSSYSSSSYSSSSSTSGSSSGNSSGPVKTTTTATTTDNNDVVYVDDKESTELRRRDDVVDGVGIARYHHGVDDVADEERLFVVGNR
ncbi:hypothetical protein HZH66_008495 [Vespula vulgaris]|uniref:Uncharacterized protein n=1 Tax=Vespula vulgaris TaxID=7454 RepID=A0A834JQX2_VESVU|nr:hypothetical protein HZH66_008495 [Vespula vulgaris]